MNKVAMISGLIALVCAVVIRVGAYFEGLSFANSWFYPIIVVPIILLSSILFVVYFLSLLLFVKKTKPTLRILGRQSLIIALVVGVFYFPFPTFLDGMHEAVYSKLDRDRLLEMAEESRKTASVAALRERFSQELSLSEYPPRINVSEDSVEIYYGGALSKHWGYAVVETDKCPRDYIPSHLCRKVFDNVWVYKDIW
ncbi:hypothetical protein [Pelagibius sp. Alg239-R121]|uniref:hypothetical protein n=1 Tax=Pelagibius sp. Alg239-R121 TaxID=2993448 RepID=UPI0024A76BF1|nr:hypothetical protein [Pelagibius sp. Alg239-R121]